MRYIVAIACAWLIAQSLKHLFRLLGKNRRVFDKNSRSPFMLSGGMPSAHAAAVTSLTTMVGLVDGVNSGLFAVSLLFSSIVIYDAVMVRFSSGQQGDLLNKLVAEMKSKLGLIRVAHGHTILEVTAGTLLGVAVALVVFSTTN